MKADSEKKKGIGVGGCAQHVLGSKISQGAQVSRIKDVEKGIKNIHGVGTLKHACRHTHLSAVCGAAELT